MVEFLQFYSGVSRFKMPSSFPGSITLFLSLQTLSDFFLLLSFVLKITTLCFLSSVLHHFHQLSVLHSELLF